MRTWIPGLFSLLLLSSPAACDRAAAGPPDPAPAGAAQAPARVASNPLAGASTAERGALLRGRVVEILDAGSYTYLALDTEAGARRWIVLLGDASVEPGDVIDVEALGTRADFHSRRLDRDFDELTFAVRLDRAGPRRRR